MYLISLYTDMHIHKLLIHSRTHTQRHLILMRTQLSSDMLCFTLIQSKPSKATYQTLTTTYHLHSAHDFFFSFEYRLRIRKSFGVCVSAYAGMHLLYGICMHNANRSPFELNIRNDIFIFQQYKFDINFF